jgi:hypothetical protein
MRQTGPVKSPTLSKGPSRDVSKEKYVLFRKNFTIFKNCDIFRFEKQLIIALKEKGWDGKEEEDTVSSLYEESLTICSPLSLLFLRKEYTK